MEHKNKPRLVSIDFGLRRLGLAISDESKLIAFPFLTLQAEKKTDETVAKLLKILEKECETHRYTLEAIIVGLPLLMNGKKGWMADEVNHFISHLQNATHIPLITWDERLTSSQAERALRETQLTRKKRAQIVDKTAAVILLQSYLDHLHFSLS